MYQQVEASVVQAYLITYRFWLANPFAVCLARAVIGTVY